MDVAQQHRVYVRVNLPRYRAHRWYDVERATAVELVANGFATETGAHGEPAPPGPLEDPCCGRR